MQKSKINAWCQKCTLVCVLIFSFSIYSVSFPISSAIVFVVMMLMVVALLILMTKTVWFTLLHNAENSASDRRLRERFDETRSFVDESDTRL